MNVLLDMPENLMPGIQDVVRVFYPEARFNTGGQNLYLSINPVTAENGKPGITVSGRVTFEHKLFSELKTTVLPPGVDRDNQIKRLSRLVAFRLLQMNTGSTPTPWGTFTGIRPTKIVHRLLDEGLAPEEIVLRLKKDFAVREDKALLLSNVAVTQRPYLPRTGTGAGSGNGAGNEVKAEIAAEGQNLKEAKLYTGLNFGVTAGSRPGAADVAGKNNGTGDEEWSKAIDGTGKISIYIGIPFCPTRCLYCSFPAYPLNKFGKWVELFTGALAREIQAVGTALKNVGAVVQSIYVGGGTPTCLPPAILDDLLARVNNHLRSRETIEFTVEGGRPDTLTREVLEICAASGVDRISINPQTMQEKTLFAIGRSHSVQDVFLAMERARETGFKTINMDIILGLPGETAAHVRDTMSRLKELRPENISVHTLAIKRASRLRRELTSHPLAGQEEARAMLEVSRRETAEMGMIPYYLYRQKRMLGNLENIGYALPGYECIYNIQIMEERQTVLGLGAGAGTKWVRPGDWFLTGEYNPKEPKLYVERIDDIIAKKYRNIMNSVITAN